MLCPLLQHSGSFSSIIKQKKQMRKFLNLEIIASSFMSNDAKGKLLTLNFFAILCIFGVVIDSWNTGLMGYQL